MSLNIPLKIIAHVKDGRLKVSGLNRFDDVVRHFEGEDVIVTIEELKNKRTLEQNAYYWGAVLPAILDEYPGHTPEELHTYFKKFLPTKFITVFGKEIAVEKSTTKLSTKEFSEYIEKICREVGIPVPNTEGWKLHH